MLSNDQEEAIWCIRLLHAYACRCVIPTHKSVYAPDKECKTSYDFAVF